MSSERESLIAGFDVGGTSVRAALVAVDGRLVGSTTDEPRRPDALGQVRELRERLVAEAAASGRTVVRTGLCVAGSVEAGTGRIASAPTAPALVGLQPRAPSSGPGIDALANDANAALVGEWRFGAARGVSDAVGIFVGTGVGGAAIIAGRQLLGASGVAFEAGHIVVDPNGPSCACGGAGCLEHVASGTALARRFAETTGGPADARAQPGRRAPGIPRHPAVRGVGPSARHGGGDPGEPAQPGGRGRRRRRGRRVRPLSRRSPRRGAEAHDHRDRARRPDRGRRPRPVRRCKGRRSPRIDGGLG